MESEFNFEHLLSEIMRKQREATLRWRASVLKHSHTDIKATGKSHLLVRVNT